jgi:hypothetical protein
MNLLIFGSVTFGLQNGEATYGSIWDLLHEYNISEKVRTNKF